MSKIFAAILSTSFFIAVGCSNPFGGGQSSVDPNHRPGVPETPFGRGADFVSASQQFKTTNGGRFKVQGSMNSGPQQINTQNSAKGYKIILDVQGELFNGALQ